MKRKLGFGLIEMLVVVGAISALAAIGYPTVEKGFEKSKESNDITAMQSADSLITSAALSGKMIGGKPARDYTRDNPLYFDEGGNLVAAKPVGYGRGTAKSGGEVWSSCNDYAYDPSLDYTGAYIVCWYDSATRIAHVHWSKGDHSTGTPSATAPTYATFPTRPTTEPTDPSDSSTEPSNEPTIPSTEPTEEPASRDDPDIQYILKDAHPWPTMIKNNPGDYSENTNDYPVHAGHRYWYEGPEGKTMYIAHGSIPYPFDYDNMNPAEWKGNFSKVIGTNIWDSRVNVAGPGSMNEGCLILAGADPQNAASYVVNVREGDIFVQFDEEGNRVAYYIWKVNYPVTTNQEAPSRNKQNWELIKDCPNDCGAEYPNKPTTNSNP